MTTPLCAPDCPCRTAPAPIIRVNAEGLSHAVGQAPAPLAEPSSTDVPSFTPPSCTYGGCDQKAKHKVIGGDLCGRHYGEYAEWRSHGRYPLPAQAPSVHINAENLPDLPPSSLVEPEHVRKVRERANDFTPLNDFLAEEHAGCRAVEKGLMDRIEVLEAENAALRKRNHAIGSALDALAEGR